MYLEMLNNKDVIINTNSDVNIYSYEDLLNTRIFKLMEIAKCLKAKSAKLFNLSKNNYADNIVLSCIDKHYDKNVSEFISQKAKLHIELFWCEANECMFIDRIYYNGENVGYYTELENGKVKPNDVIENEEYKSLDIKSYNYDFTIMANDVEYLKVENDKIKRFDKSIKNML